MSDPLIEREFPACAAEGYVETSPATPDYNCIAWAAGQTDIAWWPLQVPGCYWPLRVPPKADVNAFVQAFAMLNYVACDNGTLEAGFEKIAIYALEDGTPTHAARQLSDGSWTSKLGRYKDITHATPAALESSAKGRTDYGVVVACMKRPRTSLSA